MEQWLQQFSQNAETRDRSFTVHPRRAEHYTGALPLRLCDVALLLLAAAVEGGSSYFRIHGQRDCLFSWKGAAGPSLQAALSVLATEGVDYVLEDSQTLILPDLFREFLEPFFVRTKHAPLSVIVGDRKVWGGLPERGVWARGSRTPGLVLVDRGVDFSMPFAFPGLQVVASVEPLAGAPWPRRLVWNHILEQQVRQTARHFL